MSTVEIEYFNHLNGSLEVLNGFSYQRDVISREDDYPESIITRVRAVWEKFRELL